MGRMRARPKVDEARDILANVVVCHVPVVHYNFQQKVQDATLLYLCVLPGDFAWRPHNRLCALDSQNPLSSQCGIVLRRM